MSPKRQVIFENVQAQQDSLSHSSIRSLCPTRWTIRTGAMEAIVANYEVLQCTMEMSSHGTDDCSRHASGVLAIMDKVFNIFWAKVVDLDFQHN